VTAPCPVFGNLQATDTSPRVTLSCVLLLGLETTKVFHITLSYVGLLDLGITKISPIRRPRPAFGIMYATKVMHSYPSRVFWLALETTSDSPIRPLTSCTALLAVTVRQSSLVDRTDTGLPISSLDPCHQEVNAHTPGLLSPRLLILG
jgi:hypothetical protein